LTGGSKARTLPRIEPGPARGPDPVFSLWGVFLSGEGPGGRRPGNSANNGISGWQARRSDEQRHDDDQHRAAEQHRPIAKIETENTTLGRGNRKLRHLRPPCSGSALLTVSSGSRGKGSTFVNNSAVREILYLGVGRPNRPPCRRGSFFRPKAQPRQARSPDQRSDIRRRFAPKATPHAAAPMRATRGAKAGPRHSPAA
jgi:hypothetical protein